MSEEKNNATNSQQTKETEQKTEKNAKDEKQQTVEIPEKFASLVEQIEKMSVLDLAEFVKILEEKFNVSAATPVAMAAVPAATEPGAATEEKTEFDVELTSVGDNKIAIIKTVKEITGLGLKDAKDKVDAAPVVIKEKIKKEEAEEIKKKLEEAGATVTLK